MEFDVFIGFIKESIFMIAVFGVFLAFAMIRGRQSLTNLILALYIAFLISLKFPYYSFVITAEDAKENAIITLVIFAIFAFLAFLIFSKLMPVEFEETAFNSLGKKIILALLATALIMSFSYHALPVTDIITPGTPIQTLFAPESRFFWWLILPLVGLFLL